MKQNKILCFEGIRALACIGVFLCHYKGSFFPNSEIVAKLSKTPLNIMFTGNTFVRILFVLSGFVLSYKFISSDNIDQSSITSNAVKRYFRLMPAVLVTDLAVYLLMKFGLLFNQETAVLTHSESFLGQFNTFVPQFRQCLKEGLWGNLFAGTSAFVGPMWTMMYEMYGALLVFAVLSVLQKKGLRYIFYVVFIGMFKNYFVYFILGMFICELYCDRKLNNLWCALKKHSLILTLVFFGSLYYIAIVYDMDTSRLKYWLFSLMLLLMFLSLVLSDWMNKICDIYIIKTLGRLSFAIYLVHWPIIESFSCAYYMYMEGGRFQDGC